MPLTTTVYSTQTSGTTAIATDSVTRTVARLLVNLRRRLSCWNVGALTGWSSVAVMTYVLPATAARASELTMNVRMNSTRPAAMYAPALYWSLNSEAAAAILLANV